jgi:hypothetical protein
MSAVGDIMDTQLFKYPRTPHLEGSRLQAGDEDLSATPFRQISSSHLIIEEKLDGANCGISFDEAGNLQLQSRGHFLTGGPRERHFHLFKRWANHYLDALFDILSDRYVMYGEWMYCKHTVFYDQLPHYFLEFDVMERASGRFLSTDRRRELIGSARIVSVPVLHKGRVRSLDQLKSFVQPSLYKSASWKDSLAAAAREQDLDPALIQRQTCASDLAEGLYIKEEADGVVLGRYKFIRPDFLQSILDSGTHWLDRSILPNQLRGNVDIFAALEACHDL